MDLVIDLNTGYINWDEIKKLTKDPDLDSATKQFKCKKCNISFVKWLMQASSIQVKSLDKK